MGGLSKTILIWNVLLTRMIKTDHNVTQNIFTYGKEK